MQAFGRALGAELLKLKRTLALWAALLVPAAVVLLFFLNYARPGGANLIPQGADAWLWVTQNALILWSLVMLPPFVALETALLGALEHNNGGWKHLFALPLPRAAVYAAKLVVGTALVGLAMASLGVWLWLAGVAINALNPGTGFGAPFPWTGVGGMLAATYLAAWLMIATHTWFALRWGSFVGPIAVGIVMVFVTLVVSQTRLWWLSPWALPGNVEGLLYTWLAAGEGPGLGPVLRVLAASLGGFVLAGFAGGREVVRRDVL